MLKYIYLKLHFLIIIFEIYFYIFQNLKESKTSKNTKICICTLGKEENRYIREYVQHYKDYGVDKIYLYDNNDKMERLLKML